MLRKTLLWSGSLLMLYRFGDLCQVFSEPHKDLLYSSDLFSCYQYKWYEPMDLISWIYDYFFYKSDTMDLPTNPHHHAHQGSWYPKYRWFISLKSSISINKAIFYALILSLFYSYVWYYSIICVFPCFSLLRWGKLKFWTHELFKPFSLTFFRISLDFR